MAYIGLRCDVEREARDRKLNAAERLALRQAQARPVLDDIQRYLKRSDRTCFPRARWATRSTIP
jgi:hypothetical protein